jgi:multiple antibiotic resistance protein
MTVLSAALLLFLVMDPVGNIPFFLAALSTVPPERQQRVVARELAIALGVLVVFLFAGRWLLEMLHISEPALGVSGGVILFIIAVHMIFPAPQRSLHENVRGEPFIVPLAIPYVAGPSAMATLILITSREPGRWLEWLVALLLAWGATSIVLYFGSGMRRFLSERGLIAMERLMGMVLITVAIQMLMDGIEAFLGR